MKRFYHGVRQISLAGIALLVAVSLFYSVPAQAEEVESDGFIRYQVRFWSNHAVVGERFIPIIDAQYYREYSDLESYRSELYKTVENIQGTRIESRDPSIASVDDNGVITALSEGSTIIEMTYPSGDSWIFQLNVNPKVDLIHDRTEQSIREKWEEYKPVFDGSPYLVKPKITYPHEPGQLHPDFLKDGLNYANFVRYLAGLPDDLRLKPDLNELAQYGAVLLSNVGYLTHHPEKPADMDDGFFEKGYQSTSSSNLHSGSSNTRLNSFVQGYMNDLGSYTNLSTAGHRRWVLSPKLKYVGFGLAENDSACFSPMQVFDNSRTEILDYDFISWPGRGSFPIEVFNNGLTPWSVSVNERHFDKDRSKNITVQLTNERTGKEWHFTAEDDRIADPHKYMNIDTANYGYTPFTIIFRPDGVDRYQAGDRYSVVIDGLYNRVGDKEPIEFEVDFFTLMEEKEPQKNSEIIREPLQSNHIYISETEQRSLDELRTRTTFFNTTASSGYANVLVNGKEVKTTPPAHIVNGSTFIPLRGVFEAIGAEVEWESYTQQVVIRYMDKTVILQIGSKKARVLTAVKGGLPTTKEFDIPVAPFIKDGSTFIPLRFVAESIGGEVKWHLEDYTASIIAGYNLQD